ncbi:hypothetical protein E2562_007362 [Oryza meyeriana var. granulata]|uniref:peptidylprolyl isomerase n=1 Tax=Oryza meyeriana var. granulata TaxID=110450 RepID=A0A6G1CY61_9ORYZ|nr:hypothetical protein E2562_007362 [Oryza meyeriana var. granulata]
MGNWATAQPNSVEATHEAVNRKPISSDQPTAATRSHSPATSPPSHAAAFHPSLPPPATSMDLVRALAALPAPPLPLPAQLTKARHGPQPSTTSAPVPAAGAMLDRRRLLLIPAISISVGSFQYAFEKEAAKAEFADMPALRGKDYGKTKMRYPDYTETESGLQYKDLRVGDGPSPKKGETVVVDWDGYTIGYYGRIFEARNKTKGGSFEGGDKDFFKFKLGSGQVIPAFEEAISGMAPGGVRRRSHLSTNN